MKINPHDAHDRLLHFNKQADKISQGCLDCIKNRPKALDNHNFYIFAHARTLEDGATKKVIWSIRLTRPKPQTNSMLFKYYSNNDVIKIIWMIPARELWEQYQKDKLTEHKIICESIDMFENHRKKLSENESDDYPQEKIRHLMKEIGREAQFNRMIKSMKNEIRT